MNYWWVNQSRNDEFERANDAVCASDSPSRPKYRAMVSQAGVGDFVVHYTSTKGVWAVSRVVEEPVRISKKAGRLFTKYGKGWFLKTQYHDLLPAVPGDLIKLDILKLKIKDGPVLQWRDGQVRIRREYFIPFSREGLAVIYRAAPDRNWPAWLIKDLRLGKLA